jgi:hypothetical protein
MAASPCGWGGSGRGWRRQAAEDDNVFVVCSECSPASARALYDVQYCSLKVTASIDFLTFLFRVIFSLSAVDSRPRIVFQAADMPRYSSFYFAEDTAESNLDII